MKIINKLFAGIHQRLLAARITRETYCKILPHLSEKADHGYQFRSNGELAESNMKEFLTTQATLRLLERAACKMPEVEGQAFRHIMHRELQARMWEYIDVAHRKMQRNQLTGSQVTAVTAT